MFGWINECTESLVVTKFGVEKWHEIKAKADCKVIDGGFIRHEYYTDESTVALVVAASEVLGIYLSMVFLKLSASTLWNLLVIMDIRIFLIAKALI